MTATARYRRVRQESYTSYGIACVATLARTTHQKVFDAAMLLFRWNEGRRSFYTDFKYLRKLLAAFELRASRKVTTDDWERLLEMAIAAIHHRVKDEVEYWHWVVALRVDGKVVVLDPRSTREQRTDMKRMPLHAYIPIKATRRKSS